MSENDNYSYFFDDFCLRCETKTLYDLSKKSHRKLSDLDFEVLRFLIENQGESVDLVLLARQAYKIEELPEGARDISKKAAIKADIERRKKELHGVSKRLRDILGDFQAERVITTTDHPRGYCFVAKLERVSDTDINFSELFNPAAPVSPADPDVSPPALMNNLSTFEKWLFGPGRRITVILSLLVIITFFISAAFTYVPIRTSQVFAKEDFTDPQSLFLKLSAIDKSLLSSYLCRNFQQELACAGGPLGQPDRQLESILNVFSGSLNDPMLYNSSRFESVALSEHSKQLQKQNLSDPASLNRSLLQDAYPTEIRKDTSVSWGKPVASLLQWVTILIAFIYALVNYKPKIFSFSGIGETDKKVAESLTMIRKYWLGLFLSWLLLYFSLFFYFGDEGIHLSKRIPISPEPFTLLANFLATTFNYFNTLLIVYCFTYLNEQGEKEKENTKNKFTNLILLLWVVTLSVYVGSFLLSGQIKSVSNIVDIFTGIIAGIAMALFVGRLQSKFFGARPWLLICLYSYTALQPLYFYLTVNDVKEGWVVFLINLYLALKCLLYLYMAWMFESTRLSFYLVKIKEKHKDIEREWGEWLSKLDRA